MAQPPASAGTLGDVRGAARLLVDSTLHVAGVVEALHGQIQRAAPPLRRRIAGGSGSGKALPDGRPHDGLPRTRGLTGLVYRSIRGTTRLVGRGLDSALAALDPLLAAVSAPTLTPTLTPLPADAGPHTPRRDGLVAAANGVLGDHLAQSGNPLAIPMQLRQHGQPLDFAAPSASPGPGGVPGRVPGRVSGRVQLLVHGLCMSDLGWLRKGHDHGQALGRALGMAPVYAWYNSGQHIATNGRDLADALEHLMQRWPVPLSGLFIVGHSMGGLVARSACHQAQALGHSWPQRLQKMVFIGTPHHGAPLERAGNWLHRLLGLSPYAAPFARLSGLRSAGITDLRHGNLLQSDWAGAARFDQRDLRTPVPLPAGVGCYAIASTAGRRGTAGPLLGDGLVGVDSALGRHKRRALALGLPRGHTWVAQGVHHMDLLSDAAVYQRLLAWLGA